MLHFVGCLNLVSAFACVEEEADEELVPYLDHIVPVFVQAFQRYQVYLMFSDFSTAYASRGVTSRSYMMQLAR